MIIKKLVSLAKIGFFTFVVNLIGVVIRLRRALKDWSSELLDWHPEFRLHVSLLCLLVMCVALFVLASYSDAPFYHFTYTNVQPGIRPEKGCTIFYAADDKVALAGNNEDYSNPYTYVWFVPPEPGKYGRVYFGFEDGFPQGGVNDEGLFMDGSSLPKSPLSQSSKPVYEGYIPPGDLVDKIMSESATVSEALEILDSYSHVGMDTYQLLFGDASGDSMIVDGDIVVHKQGSFQIATNFRLSENPDPPYACPRYNAALDRLSKADSFTAELFRDILDATHQELPNFPTLYSNIYDLKKGLIYVYLYHDFKNVVIIDVAAELAKGFHYSSLASLFPSHAEAADYQAQRQSIYETKIPGRVTPTGQEQITDIAGDYRVGEKGETMSIYLEAGRLYFLQNFSLPIELFSQAKDRFFHQFHDGSELMLIFQRDDRGTITGAMGTLYGVRFNLERLDTTQSSTLPTPVLRETEVTLSPMTAPEITISHTTAPEITIAPTAAAASILNDPFHDIPWLGWTLIALAVIVIFTIGVRFIIRK